MGGWLGEWLDKLKIRLTQFNFNWNCQFELSLATMHFSYNCILFLTHQLSKINTHIVDSSTLLVWSIRHFERKCCPQLWITIYMIVLYRWPIIFTCWSVANFKQEFSTDKVHKILEYVNHVCEPVPWNNWVKVKLFVIVFFRNTFTNYKCRVVFSKF